MPTGTGIQYAWLHSQQWYTICMASFPAQWAGALLPFRKGTLPDRVVLSEWLHIITWYLGGEGWKCERAARGGRISCTASQHLRYSFACVTFHEIIGRTARNELSDTLDLSEETHARATQHAQTSFSCSRFHICPHRREYSFVCGFRGSPIYSLLTFTCAAQPLCTC